MTSRVEARDRVTVRIIYLIDSKIFQVRAIIHYLQYNLL